MLAHTTAMGMACVRTAGAIVMMDGQELIAALVSIGRVSNFCKLLLLTCFVFVCLFVARLLSQRMH
jgi:hypothetical protein